MFRRITSRRRDYNGVVAVPVHKPEADVQHRHRQHAYAAEATGLLVIGVLLFVLALARYWAFIHWSIR